MFRRRSTNALTVCLVLLTALAPSRRLPFGVRPDIVLITVDSLRADALGCYGYRRPTSPNIDAFAKSAVVVTDVLAQAPFTKPSIASLMTGLFPGTHKTYSSSKPAASIMKRGGHVKGAFQATDALPPQLTTLSEVLRATGYRTVGLTTNPYLIRDFGYDKGFDDFRFYASGEAYTRARPVLADALKALTGPRAQPVFVWIHLMDTHNPYTPAEPYRSMFQPDGPPQTIPEAAIDEAARIEGSRDVNLYRARYDACVREVDAEIGAFFAALQRAGTWDKMSVVLTADHGEEFFEHRRMGHNTDLFDEQVRVPLILKIPGLEPARLRMSAQLLDLYPTLIHIAGGRVRPSHGTDLVPVLSGRQAPERYAFAELPGKAWTVRTREWKLISAVPGSQGRLFHLAGDSEERQDVSPQHQVVENQMRRVLGAALSTEMRDGRKVKGREVPVSPAVMEQLRALGYVTPE